MTQLISKIKLLSAQRTEIEMSEEVTTDQSKTVNTSNIESDEVRHPDFTAAGEAIVPIVRKVFNIQKDWEVEFKSVSINRDDGYSAMIGLYLRFGKDFSSGAQIVMPKLTDEPKNGMNKMPIQLYDAIVKLVDEASKFAFNNKRAQGSLPLEQPKTDEELEAEEQRKILPIGASSNTGLVGQRHGKKAKK
jgi:hypothetical protein